MSKTNYTLSSKVGSDNKSQILVRFVASRTDIYRAKTNIWIHHYNWDNRQNYPRAGKKDKSDIDECRRVQRALDDLTEVIISRYNEDKTHGKKWLTELLSGLQYKVDGTLLSVVSTEFSSMGISDSWELMIQTELANNAFTASTAKVYRRTLDKIRDFETERVKIRLCEFTPKTLDEFMLYARNRYRLSDNYLYNIRASISRWWRWCQGQDDTLHNMPNTAGKIKGKVFGTPYYLTKEERDKLYRYPLTKYKDIIVRDSFVFQCLVGCRYSDLISLTTANVAGDKIVYIAKKTIRSNPQTITVPLHPIAKEIIQRYKGKQKTLMPIGDLAHQSFDYSLRKAIRLSGIDMMLTIRDCHTGEQTQRMLSEVASSHMARRTFIGCLYEAGFRESDICSMSGHREGSLSIQRYRRVSDERKRMMIDAI